MNKNEDKKMSDNLEKIFMPYSLNKRMNMIRRKGKFVHYTSAENAVNIIRGKQLWMRNARCMNDYMEMAHGHKMLFEYFNTPDKRQGFCDAFNWLSNGIVEETLSLFDQWWSDINYNTYITSISEHNDHEDEHGRLSMWRAYGQTSAKAAIVLNVPLEDAEGVKPLNLFLSPVAYFEYSDVIRELDAVVENAIAEREFLKTVPLDQLKGMIFLTLVMAVVSLKHNGFSEEQEWRIVYLPRLYQSEFMKKRVETIGGIPQVVYKIPLEDNEEAKIYGIGIPNLVHKVLVGPSIYPLTICEAFDNLLAESGVDASETRVHFSLIPLRT